MADEQLVRSAQKGDEEAFFALMQINKAKLYRIAFAFLKHEEQALDAIQEVTCRVYSQLHRLREPKFFDTWLVRILLNYCATELKRQRRWHNEWQKQEPIVTPDNDTRLGLEEALEQLPSNYKQVIVLKYFQDFTISEISRILETPEGTIKTWLHKALHKLRRNLEKGGER